jgi:hypothetical protein
MRTFLRRVGLLLGLLRAPEPAGAKPGAAKEEPRKSTRMETAVALGVSTVLLVLIAAMVLETKSGLWRAIGFVAFCVLAIGLGQRVKNLTRRG